MSIPFQLLARQLSLLTVPWQIIQSNSQGTGEGAAGAKIEANESGSIAMTAPPIEERKSDPARGLADRPCSRPYSPMVKSDNILHYRLSRESSTKREKCNPAGD
jgi:hypothetical protein